VNWFRAWFHSSRFDRLRKFVEEHHRDGMNIADLGCGNCLWNTNSLPVAGVDINENMMRHALEQRRLAEYHVRSDLADTRLAENSFDIVVMSETLEHLLDPPRVLAEVHRILKNDGVFLITVPYDIFLGPFFVLFNINCLYQGYVKGSIYHRYRCGHVNHFTKSRLRKVMNDAGWRVQRLDVVNGLSLYAAAKKTVPPSSDF